MYNLKNIKNVFIKKVEGLKKKLIKEICPYFLKFRNYMDTFGKENNYVLSFIEYFRR